METMKLEVTITDAELAALAAFLVSDANLVQESGNNDGRNPPEAFASLVSCERGSGHGHLLRATLEVGVAYNWRQSSHSLMEHRLVTGNYLLALVEAIGIFPSH